jgi:AraC-like DNA-binding protein
MSGTILTVSTKAVLDYCARMGVDTDAMLDAVGVARSTINDFDARITREKQMEIWRRAYQTSRDPDLALHAAESLPLGAYRVVDYLAVSAPTVGAAISQVSAYFPIINSSVRLPIELGPDEVLLSISCPDEPSSITRPYVEYTFVAIFQRIREAIGYAFPLRRVEMAFSTPPRTCEHERIFACPLRFGCTTNLVRIAREVWDMPNRRHDPGLFGVLCDHARTVALRVSSDPATVQDVRKVIAAQLKDGAPSLEGVAKQLAMSPRTLQRRLAEHGVSYADLLDNIRAGAAKSYLGDRELTLAEVAYLVGFSEQSSFSHAFKRWTGQVPKEYRRSM